MTSRLASLPLLRRLPPLLCQLTSQVWNLLGANETNSSTLFALGRLQVGRNLKLSSTRGYAIYALTGLWQIGFLTALAIRGWVNVSGGEGGHGGCTANYKPNKDQRLVKIGDWKTRENMSRKACPKAPRSKSIIIGIVIVRPQVTAYIFKSKKYCANDGEHGYDATHNAPMQEVIGNIRVIYTPRNSCFHPISRILGTP